MNKEFDCVVMKQKGAAKVHRDLAGLTPDERLEYWNKAYAELVHRQKTLQAKTRKKLQKAA